MEVVAQTTLEVLPQVEQVQEIIEEAAVALILVITDETVEVACLEDLKLQTQIRVVHLAAL